MRTVHYSEDENIEQPENQYERFVGQKVWVHCLDGTKRLGKLIGIYQFEFLVEADLTPKKKDEKKEIQLGYILYMKHAVKYLKEYIPSEGNKE